MHWFKTVNKLCKTATLQRRAALEVSGPVVDQVLTLVKQMFNLGAPNVYDAQGFNKLHFGNSILNELRNYPLGSKVDAGKINYAVICLTNYPKQISNIKEVKAAWEAELAKVKQTQNPQQQTQQQSEKLTPEGKLKVSVIGKNQYGNYLVLAPESDERITPILFNKWGNLKAHELGFKQEIKSNPYGSSYKTYPDLFKSFYRMSKSTKDPQPHTFAVSHKFLSTLSKMLQEYNATGKPLAAKKGIPFLQYDTSALDALSTQEAPAASAPAQEAKPKVPLKVQFGIKEATATGYAYSLKYPMPANVNWKEYSQKIREQIKFQLGGSMAQDIVGNKFAGWILTLDHEKLPQLEKLFADLNYDTSEIKEVYEKIKSKPQEIQTKEEIFPLSFVDISNKGPYHFAIQFTQQAFKFRKDKMEDFQKIIEFTFPIEDKKAEDGIGDRTFDSVGKYGVPNSYCIRGKFNDYSELKLLLMTKHFDTSSLRSTVRKMVMEKKLTVGRIEGVADGYEKRTPDGKLIINPVTGLPEEDTEKFYADVAKYKISKNGKVNDILPKQAECIKWQYSRNTILNGGATGIGKCVKGDTRIIVNDIVTTMEDLWSKYGTNPIRLNNEEEWQTPEQDLFIHSVDGCGKITKGRIEGLFRQYFKGKLRKILTENNRSVTCTYQHKFLTPKGWTNELSENDIICTSVNLKKLNSSTSVSAALAYLLGWQISEGNETRNCCTITQHNKKVLGEIETAIKTLINEIPELNKSKAPKVKEKFIVWYSTRYRKYLLKHGYKWGVVARHKCVPDIIMNAPNEEVKIFLRAFFDGEGYSSKSIKHIDITSASERLIYQISALLSRFNINHSFGSAFKKATNGKTQEKKRYYFLNLIGDGTDKFAKEIGFGYKYKQNNYLEHDKVPNYNKGLKPSYLLLSDLRKQSQLSLVDFGAPGRSKEYVDGPKFTNNQTIKMMASSLLSVKNRSCLSKYKTNTLINKAIKRIESADPVILEKTSTALLEMADNDLSYEKIKSIEVIDFEGYIYDLTIQEHHNFIAEGICCHNTMLNVVAADMRTKKSGGRVLIVTVKNVVPQYMQEIKALGLGNGGQDISNEPAAGKKWTVMYYNQFDTSTEAISPKEQEKLDLLIDTVGIQFPQFKQLWDIEKQTTNPLVFMVKIKSQFPQIAEYGPFEQWEKLVTKLEYKKKEAEKAKQLIETIAAQNFEVLIMDESHSVKNDSNTSDNVIECGKNIPFRWGATATASANRPIDVYRQLKSIGHRLGRIPFNKFKREFTGIKAKQILNSQGKPLKIDIDPSSVNAFFNFIQKNIKTLFPGKVDVHQLSEEEILSFADQVLKPSVYAQMVDVMKLNTWLILTDVYKSMTKEEINPNMPEHITGDYEVEPTAEQTKELNELVQSQLQKYKDPTFEVSKMLAFRQKMALMKAPVSCKLAIDLIKTGKKVLIFTCFKETADAIQNSMNSYLAPFNSKCEKIMGGEDTDKRLEKLDSFKDMPSNVRCLVLGVLSGGTGIDLPNIVENVIINDYDWTPKSAEQSEGRAFRISSKTDVRTLYVILKNTPDAIYYKTVQKKRHIAGKVQSIDNEYAKLVLENKPVGHLVKLAQEEQWNIVHDQVIEKIRVMEWWRSLNLTAKSWFSKLTKLARLR